MADKECICLHGAHCAFCIKNMTAKCVLVGKKPQLTGQIRDGLQ